MSILKDKMMLNNGIEIPAIALGTWQIDNETVVRCVKDAYDLGYRHIDSASDYQNEEGVGRAIKELKIDRNSIFITTKVPASIKNYKEAVEIIKESLRKLDLGYIDLLLIHAPAPWPEMGPNRKAYFNENLEVWRAMEEFYKMGLVKAIGVSNFNVADVKNILDNCEIKPTVNQIPAFIGYIENDTIDFCKENNILIEAYSPVATGRLLKSEYLKNIAAKYGVTSAQLCIKFDYQLGLLPLPKSTHKEYMKENAELDFVISDEDMALLSKLKQEDILK
ncbi:MAG: aldo/keto reductase [Erysipelotrichales bacterium]|nr:aldo/keto reductase [Erysipelotrichales bacterium]